MGSVCHQKFSLFAYSFSISSVTYAFVSLLEANRLIRRPDLASIGVQRLSRSTCGDRIWKAKEAETWASEAAERNKIRRVGNVAWESHKIKTRSGESGTSKTLKKRIQDKNRPRDELEPFNKRDLRRLFHGGMRGSILSYCLTRSCPVCLADRQI